MGIGNSFSSLDLRMAKDTNEITGRIARSLRVLPRGRWLGGTGWSAFPPDRAAIDRISPANPVFLYSGDARSAFVNRVAAELAGLKSHDPGGIVRGDELQRVAHRFPRDHTRNWIEVAETATNHAAALGVTSVQDMHSDDSREIYRELERQGKL
ncbi:MAG TPA: amidohydrolase family protein, partial [Candidatus Binatia bacterium]|nr:amidohydrolase family protein [Candidatus Binatia bacterium]